MSTTRVELDLEVTFLTTEEGGRKTPPGLNAFVYRPHLVVGDPSQRAAVMVGNRVVEQYLGVEFASGPAVFTLGEQVNAMAYTMWDHPDFDQLVQGVTFTIREGAKIVAWGRVCARRERAV